MHDRAPIKGPAAPNAIESEDTDQGREHVSDSVETGDPGDICIANTSSAEDSGSVDSDTCDTDPLLHDLEPDNELDTATSVKLARAETEEHRDVRLSASSLALKLADVADILEFSFGLAEVLTAFTTETTKDVTSFLLAADLGEPTRRFREDPYNAEKEQKRDNLERNWESPDERGFAVHVE